MSRKTIRSAAEPTPSTALPNQTTSSARFPTYDIEHALSYASALFEVEAKRAEDLSEYQWANLCYLELARFPVASHSEAPDLAPLLKRVSRLLKNVRKDARTWASIVLARKVEPDERLSDEEREQLNLARQMHDPLARRARSLEASRLEKEDTASGQFQLFEAEVARSKRAASARKGKKSKKTKIALAIKLLLGNRRLKVREIATMLGVAPSTLHRDTDFKNVNAARRKANQEAPKVKHGDTFEPPEDEESRED